MRIAAALVCLLATGLCCARADMPATVPESDPLLTQALSGNGDAQAQLATRYLLGESLLADYGSGYFWALLARQSGHVRGPALTAAVEGAIDDAEFQRIVRERAESWRPGMRSMPYASGVVAYVPPLPPGRIMPPFEVLQIADAVALPGSTAEHPDAAWTLLLARRPVSAACADGSSPQRETCVVVSLDADARVLAARFHGDSAFALPKDAIEARFAVVDGRLKGTLSMSGPPAEVSPSVAFDVQFDVPLAPH